MKTITISNTHLQGTNKVIQAVYVLDFPVRGEY